MAAKVAALSLMATVPAKPLSEKCGSAIMASNCVASMT